MTSDKVKFSSKDARFLIDSFGFAIFPVWGIDENMNCMCGDSHCKNQGKHPATNNGVLDASKDIEAVKALWAGRSGLNVGIATGKVSNCFVVDIDGHQAELDLQVLIDQYGELPITLQQTTGRGRHLFFKYPEGVEKIPTRRGVIGDKIDVRGDGGYVVGYKSTHKSGAVYDFVNPLDDIADAPQWLINAILKPIKNNNNSLSLVNYTGKQRLNLIESEWSNEQVSELLTYIHPDESYDNWYQIGMALKDYGCPFSLFDSWSAKGSKYDGSVECRKKWDSFKGRGVSIGTVVFFAKKGGWKPQARQIYNVPQMIQHAPQCAKFAPQKIVESVDPVTGEITETEKPKRLFYINAPDIEIQLDTNDFVQGFLSSGAMSVVYGESNCGKTFFMSDLAFHIVEGKVWNGKRIEQGNVLYISMEGAYGLKNRIAAYRKETGAKLNGFLVMPCSIDFISDQTNDISELIDIIEIAKSELGEIKLIVIDTLARAIGGGDENSGQDMGKLVKHADIIRSVTGAHISFIHHSGKDKARGARGHSSLRAAVDTEVEISRKDDADYSSVRVVKQRDMEKDNEFNFKLKRIVLGVNRHNEEVSSCIVEPYDLSDDVEKTIEKRIKSGKTKTAFDALKEAIMEQGFRGTSSNMPNCKVVTVDVFKKYLHIRGVLSENANSNRKQFERVTSDLIENKLVVIRDNFIWVCNDINAV